MIKFLLPFLLTLSLFAEATFDQVQSMIDSKQYSQAKLALTIIESNHPNSARVKYTLAQVNAGLGDLATARTNLSEAKAIDPKLSFVPESSVKNLQKVLKVDTDLIVAVKTDPSWFEYFLVILSFGLIFWLCRLRKSKSKPTVSVAPTGTSSKPTNTYSTPVDSTFTEPVFNKPESSAREYYSNRAPERPTEVHHHHHHDSDNTISTIVTAGLTAAAVSTLMNDTDDKPSTSSTSSSWDNTPVASYSSEPSSISSSWEDTSSSSSWDDSSSSSSDSWTDSESSSSSSSGD